MSRFLGVFHSVDGLAHFRRKHDFLRLSVNVSENTDPPLHSRDKSAVEKETDRAGDGLGFLPFTEIIYIDYYKNNER